MPRAGVRDNAFVVWFLRAFIVDDEDTALAAIVSGGRDKRVDRLKRGALPRSDIASEATV
jgi:hypothetical protein